MNVGRSEYTRLLKQEVKLKKLTKLLLKVKENYEDMLVTIENEWGSGRSLEELKKESSAEEVKILLEIDELLKE